MKPTDRRRERPPGRAGLALFFLAFGGFAGTLLDYVTGTDLLPAALQRHVSNFALSGLFCLCAGLLLASIGAGLPLHGVAPVLAVLGNLVVETGMSSDNVRDMTDFAAGVAGAVIGTVVGLLIAGVGGQ